MATKEVCWACQKVLSPSNAWYFMDEYCCRCVPCGIKMLDLLPFWPLRDRYNHIALIFGLVVGLVAMYAMCVLTGL